jgi:peptide/nickel transport system ATP-binding protein
MVGESGAGKSLTGAAIIGLIEPPGRIAGGEIWLRANASTTAARGHAPDPRRRIGMVFQDPLTSLNPLYTVARQLIETIRTHMDVSEAEARKRAIALLDRVGIPAAARRIDDYPHHFRAGCASAW